MPTRSGLFQAKRLGVNCTFISTFLRVFVLKSCGIEFYDITYSYQIQIIFTQLYDFKYSYLIQNIFTLFYGFKYSY